MVIDTTRVVSESDHYSTALYWARYKLYHREVIIIQTRVGLHELIADGRHEGVLILFDPLVHVEYP